MDTTCPRRPWPSTWFGIASHHLVDGWTPRDNFAQQPFRTASDFRSIRVQLATPAVRSRSWDVTACWHRIRPRVAPITNGFHRPPRLDGILGSHRRSSGATVALGQTSGLVDTKLTPGAPPIVAGGDAHPRGTCGFLDMTPYHVPVGSSRFGHDRSNRGASCAHFGPNSPTPLNRC